uniref:Phosphatidic acid phosphatase type 2/haloperoxidase domain-containing protein n=1 Tax=Glossina brevipalpis TaxID=37001 RepID=A0A1A9WD96_9MUSC
MDFNARNFELIAFLNYETNSPRATISTNQKYRNKMTRFKSVARMGFDLLIFASLCLSEVALRKWFKPYKRGFFCDDESLRYPYHESTISVFALISIVLAVPSSVMLAVELFKQTATSLGEKRKSGANKGCHLGRRLMQCYTQIGFYLFGLALTLITTHITKYSVGRLRPHFFAVCQPLMSDGSTCSDVRNHDRYIEDYDCIAKNMSANAIAQL